MSKYRIVKTEDIYRNGETAYVSYELQKREKVGFLKWEWSPVHFYCIEKDKDINHYCYLFGYHSELFNSCTFIKRLYNFIKKNNFPDNIDDLAYFVDGDCFGFFYYGKFYKEYSELLEAKQDDYNHTIIKSNVTYCNPECDCSENF